jgi:hypothetical protein
MMAAVTCPDVFSGNGEFSIHKEFVSAKVEGEVASLIHPALDSNLAFAGEAGLVVRLPTTWTCRSRGPGPSPSTSCQ